MGATPPPPETRDVLQLFMQALLGVGGGGLGLLGLMRWYSEFQGKRVDQRQNRDATNLAEAGKLRDELRAALQLANDRADECEAEVSRWRGAFYALRGIAERLLNNALTVCHRALGELEGTRHEAAAARLGRLVEMLEKVKLPPSPEEEERKAEPD